jgi:type VI secretion system secreted protein VgrG
MGNTEAPTYRNEFTCIPAEVQYRPPRLTPEPRIPGIMTAKIETAGGDYAHIDEMGRYKVKMPFDLSDRNNAMASRALRMAQPYSGANYGIHFPNRANSEMVWACIDGNVDRPLGLSTVPNPSNTSPSVAGNKAQCVIRTAGQNELTLDDTIGSENIYLHATKDQTIQINNDKNQTVGNNETLEVGTNRTKSIGNDETLSIGNNRSKTVGADQFEKIGKNNALEVGVNYEESIGSNKSVTVGANQDVSIGKNKKEKIGGSMIQKVTRAKIENVGMAKMLSIGGAYQMTVGAVMNETVAISRTEQVGMTKTTMVGKNSIEKIGKTKTINAGEKIELVCGEGKIVIEKSGKIEIVGKELHLSATGPVKINGKIVDIN